MPKIYSQSEVLQELREQVAESSQSEVARSLGLAVSMVNDLLRGRRDVSDRVAELLGFTREVIFRKRAA